MCDYVFLSVLIFESGSAMQAMRLKRKQTAIEMFNNNSSAVRQWRLSWSWSWSYKVVKADYEIIGMFYFHKSLFEFNFWLRLVREECEDYFLKL